MAEAPKPEAKPEEKAPVKTEAKAPKVYTASPKGNEPKKRYRVVQGKLFVLDAGGKNSIRVPIGATIDLTDEEAHKRAGQVMPATVEVEAE